MTFQLADDGPAIYEKVLVPLWMQPWAEALIGLLAPASGDRVLDVACGTGVTTRLAADAVGAAGKVTGLDINAGMLATAKQLAGDRPIDWLESDVTDTALPDAAFDLILSQHGYHYFPDKPGALAEFLRLLRPGGRLAFSIWDGHSAYTQALCAAVATHISPDVAAKQRAQRATPSAEALQDQLEAAGYTDVQVLRQSLRITTPPAAEFVSLHLRSMPIAGAFLSLPDSVQSALIRNVEAALADHHDENGLIYDDAVHVAIGRRPT
ncbi:class I SAM-dependent methyltransferase [Pseudooceanicola sp. C21-150M6]|uniref:class I SAM-dependent methyltransferase n=1 Tax=Pseudooceanicola sp. C21-150M6 TaxID=3434355 RepID=UPI003D7FABCA